MRRFSKKVCLITGGSAGIGRAIVEEFCKEGGGVFFTGINNEEGILVEEMFKEQGHNVKFLSGDMADEDFCKECVTQAVSKFGKVNYLVNNAFAFTAKALDASTADWQRSFAVGPLAYARMVQNVFPYMKESGGAIVNISSISAHVAQKARWTYNASKGAVSQLTKCQALDLAPFKIRVNSIDPGWIWSTETDKAANMDGGGREKWAPVWGKYHMLRRMGLPEEVARPVLFLLSEDASFITGTTLMVDGGYCAMGPEGLGETAVIAGSD